MADNEALRFEIVKHDNNPNKEQMIAAFAHAYDHERDDEPCRVAFCTAFGIIVELHVNSLAYECGAPGMFLVGGNMRRLGHDESIQVTGFYNANKRNGTLRTPE